MVLALAVVLTVGLATVTAESEDTDVDIEIDDTTQLDVKPGQMYYTADGDEGELTPGEQREESDRGHAHIDIENMGSDRLDEIYAEPQELHSDQPFGTAPEEVDHSTANLVLMSTDTAYEEDYDIAVGGNRGDLSEVRNMTYLTRVEYFEEQPPEYIQAPESSLGHTVDVGVGEEDELSGDPEVTEVGQFRVGEASYYFVYVEEDGSDNVVLIVGNTPETPTDLGTFDFTDEGDDYTVIGLEDGTSNVDKYTDSFSLASFDVDEYNSEEPILDGDSGIVETLPGDLTGEDVEEREYNFYVDEDEVVRASFNVDVETPSGDTSTDTEATGGQQYILEASSKEGALQPGEVFPVDFGVQLPNGIDHESISEGTVTFNAEAYNN